jgi:hypothetical protein
MKMKFKMTCDEASTVCDKSQYQEASFWERIKLTFHLLNCNLCTLYVDQNRKMTHLFKMKSSACKNENFCLTTKEKEVLHKMIQDQSDSIE